jgi:P pilus assembly chaperone PapD
MIRKNIILISLIFIFLFCSSAFASWTVSPYSINFGDVSAGSSKTVTLTITNTGASVINIQNIYSSIPEVTVNADFSKDPLSIAVGKRLVVAVTFKPTARGNYSGELVIVSDDPSQPSVTVPFTGTSSYATGIDVSPTYINFGSVSVGQSATDYVRVANNGTSELNVSVSVTAGTPFTVSKTSFTLKPGQYETLMVTFTPTEKGSFSSALTIISDDKNTPKVVVSLIGDTGPEFPLYYSPSILNFGKLAINTTYEKILKVFNTSSNIVNVSIYIQNLNGGNAFSLPSSYPTSFEMGPGEIRQFPIRFLPTEKVYYSALIYLVTNTGTARISIMGDGADYIGGLEPSTPPPSSGGGGGGCSVSGAPNNISLAGNTALMIMPVVAIAMRKLYRKFRK